MSGTINKVILVGNLGDDVKMHHFDDKNCIGRFPIATSESYTKKETGERMTQTEWHNIVTRNKLAELCERYLSKGDKVYVEGKIKTRKWDDNGQTRYQTEIIADSIQFLTTKKSEGNTPQTSGADTQPTKPAAEQNSGSDDASDDLPF